MPTILFCAALAWALIVFAPNSAPGRALSRMLVEKPARLLSILAFGQLIWAVLIMCMIWGLFALARTEASFLLAQGLPEVVGWFVTLDGASIVDALALAFVLAARVGLRAAKAAASTNSRLIRTRFLRAHRTPRRPRKPQAPANEDEPAVFAVVA